MVNVLFVAGGKRCELAKRFINKGCKLWAYEKDPYSPITHYAILIRGLNFNNPEIINNLILNIEFYGIDIVIPLYDDVIPILSEIAENSHLRPKVVVSPKRCAEICLDKSLFEKFMIERFPKYYPSMDGYGDIIGKLKFGCGSKGLLFYTEDEAKVARSQDNYIYQKFVAGKEYTVDVYFGKNGQFIGAIPRLREKVIDGEVQNSSIVWDKQLIEISKNIAQELGIIGPSCLQFRQDQQTGEYFCIECNNRFGGGSTFSCEAGFDMVDFLIQEYYYYQKIAPINESQINKKLILRRTLEDNFFGD